MTGLVVKTRSPFQYFSWSVIFYVIIGFIVLCIAMLPQVYGRIISTRDKEFTGIIDWHGDVWFYLSQIHRFQSEILISNPASFEVKSSVFINPLFLIWARFGAVLRLTESESYYFLGFATSIPLVIISTTFLSARVGLDSTGTKLATLLVFFAPGMRWIFWTDNFEQIQKSFSYWPKNHTANILQQVVIVPHLAVAGSLVSIILVFIIQGFQEQHVKHFVKAGVLLAFLTSFHPFEWVPLTTTFVINLITQQITTRAPRVGSQNKLDITEHKIDNSISTQFLSFFFFPLIVIIWYAYSTSGDPMMQSISYQMGGFPTSTLIFNLVYLGPAFLIYMISIVFLNLINISPLMRISLSILEIWLIAVITLENIPIVPVPTHYYEGISIIISVLIIGILYKVSNISQKIVLFLVSVSIFVSIPTFTIYYSNILFQLENSTIDYYLTLDEKQLVNYISSRDKNKTLVISKNEHIMRYVSGLTDKSVLVSHNAMTYQADVKRRDTQTLFSPTSSLNDRHSILNKYKITTIIADRKNDLFGCSGILAPVVFESDAFQVCEYEPQWQ
jgi:hypothetical protein